MDIIPPPCRWGILGSASIAMNNWHALLNAGNCRIIAVASRSRANAHRFIEMCQASAPTGYPVDAVEGYAPLLERDDIDAVYIPLPTAVRAEWAIKAAQAGKHIVIEKPCGVNAAELQRILDTAEQYGVQIMDGTMLQHSSRLAAIREALSDEEQFGEIRRITSHFSFMGDPAWVERNRALEPAGCLGDVGWYNIRLTLNTMDNSMPRAVRGKMLQGVARLDGGMTPTEFEGELMFDNGVTATLYNAFNTSRQQWAVISGTRGYLHIKDFVLPHYGNEVSFVLGNDRFEGRGCFFNLERHERTVALPEYSNNHPSVQESQLYRAFAELVLTGKRDAFWPRIMLQTQRILDALLASANAGGATIRLS